MVSFPSSGVRTATVLPLLFAPILLFSSLALTVALYWRLLRSLRAVWHSPKWHDEQLYAAFRHAVPGFCLPKTLRRASAPGAAATVVSFLWLVLAFGAPIYAQCWVLFREIVTWDVAVGWASHRASDGGEVATFVERSGARSWFFGLQDPAARHHYEADCGETLYVYAPRQFGAENTFRDNLGPEVWLPTQAWIYFGLVAASVAMASATAVKISRLRVTLSAPLVQQGAKPTPPRAGVEALAIDFFSMIEIARSRGRSLDDAIAEAREQLSQGKDAGPGPVEWGAFIDYAATFQRMLVAGHDAALVDGHQQPIALEGGATIGQVAETLKDPASFRMVLSREAARRVLLLGRFNEPGMNVLQAVAAVLSEHRYCYVATIFDFDKPDGRDLSESILLLALLSRYVIADLSSARSIAAELHAIVLNLPSVAVQPILREGDEPFDLFSAIQRRPNVLKTLRYRDIDDLLARLDAEIVEPVELRLQQLRSS